MVTYPDLTRTNHYPLVVHFGYLDYTYQTQFISQSWELPIPINAQADLQISTNQTDWTSVATVTNLGAVIEWVHVGTNDPMKSFRVIPD